VEKRLLGSGCRLEMVSGVGRRMGVLDGGGDRRRGSGRIGINVGHPIVTNGDFVAYLFSTVRVATQLFPNYFVISCFSYFKFLKRHRTYD